ncbi:MAG: Holliday junction resolvase RuvX, partial [Caulobacteraceae bacterium]
MPLMQLEPAISANAPVVGIDIGEKTIGVAISDRTRLIASPLVVIRKTKFTADAGALMGLMRGRDAEGLIIGLPLNMDGSEGPRCQSSRAFGRNLLRLGDLPIAFWDERLSTAAIDRVLIEEEDASRARRGRVVDKLAATWILQGALDRLRADRLRGGPPAPT